MKNKKIIRFVLFMLVITMLLSMFTACKKDGVEENESISTSDIVQDTVATIADDVLELPEDMNFGGQEVTVLAWSNPECKEFEVDGIGSNSIENSIFLRNNHLKDRIGINLKYTYIPGAVGDRGEYLKHVEAVISSGDSYDILAAHTQSISLCVVNGYAKNIGKIDDASNNISLSKKWWNKSLVESCTIGDAVYALTGDISTSFVQKLYCLYFNADMLKNKGIESPYDLVEKNQWTLDKLIAMCANLFEDVNGDTIYDSETDTMALSGRGFDWPAMLHGCDVNFTTKNSSGAIVVDNIGSSKALDVMDKFQDLIQRNDATVLNGNVLSTFKDKRLAFYITDTVTASRLGNAGFEYGCVPVPKYDSSQPNYVTTPRQPITFFCMMNNVPSDRFGMVTATLEAWAWAGYTCTTPVIFGEVMQYQTSTSTQMSEMLNIIKETVRFDLCRVYNFEGMNIGNKPGDYLAANKEWSEYVNGDLPRFTSQLSTINSAFAMLDN